MKGKSSAMKGRDPDRGPPMIEGEHHYDKGYQSDEQYFSPGEHDLHGVERGNRYMQMKNEVVKKDTAKLKRSKFSKIA